MIDRQLLGENSVALADFLADATDRKFSDSVLVDTQAVLEYIKMVAEEATLMINIDPENAELYDAMVRPLLLVGAGLRAYIELRQVSAPNTIEGLE